VPATTAGLSVVDAFSIAESITSIILAVLAIILSLVFYGKSKDSERAVSSALEGIRAQTDALQRLTGRWMDRLTRYATEPKPADETLIILTQLIREFPVHIATVLRPQAPGQQQDIAALQNEALLGYIGIYYYTALTNIWTQPYLPQGDTPPPAGDPARDIVDSSFADFFWLDRIINGLDPARVQASPLNGLYQFALGLRGRVMNAEMVYQARGR